MHIATGIQLNQPRNPPRNSGGRREGKMRGCRGVGKNERGVSHLSHFSLHRGVGKK